MAQDRSIAQFIKTMSSTKVAIEVDVLKKTIESIQSTDRGPASEIIDLAFAITGYGKADIPGGEAQLVGHCFMSLVRYLSLRAKSTNEELDGPLKELITDSVRLFAEVNTNLGMRVLPLTEPQRS